MISSAGKAIFVFGNKNDNEGNVINADGLQREFDIARKNGVKIIAIGITGYQTKLIYDEIMSNFEQYYPEKSDIKGLFEELSKEENKDNLLEIIFNIISKL